MAKQLDIFGASQCIENTYIVNDDDEPHIYRYKMLDRLYTEIYSRLHIKYHNDNAIIINGLIIAYPDERQAEIIGTEFFSLKDKIKLHIKLLRLLKWKKLNLTKEITENTTKKTKI